METHIVDLGVPRSSRGSGTSKIKDLATKSHHEEGLWVPYGFQDPRSYESHKGQDLTREMSPAGRQGNFFVLGSFRHKRPYGTARTAAKVSKALFAWLGLPLWDRLNLRVFVCSGHYRR